MRRTILSEAHSKVPITTINMTPTNAAIEIISISGARKSTNISKQTAAVMPDSRPRPPELTLISDWPIIAQPPMPPNKPHTKLAAPWPMHSRLPWPRVSVISSINVSVINDSISPTPHKMTAYGTMILSVAKVSGTIAYCKKNGTGRPPLIPADSVAPGSAA